MPRISESADRWPDDAPNHREGKTKPLVLGYLTTRIMIVEREPIHASEEGLTVGQMIDNRIAEIQSAPDDGGPGARVHSLTFEFSSED
jgi:hypothetical protein